MKSLFLMLTVFLAGSALAHPGHGKPGFVHAHTLADLALILAGLSVVALAGWALLRFLWRRLR